MAQAARLASGASLAVRALLRPLASAGRCAPATLDGARRLILLQLDGVSRTRLARMLADGEMPGLSARLETGRHELSSCRSGVPASTPAFQSGLFYGVSPAVPGFVWFDRRTGREVRMDRAADAAALERRLSRAHPGLLRGGTSYFSILSGGAAFPSFCLSGLAGDLAPGLDGQRLGGWDGLASALTHSVAAARGAVRIAHEAATGLVDGVRWSAALGRLEHEPRFLLHRVLVGAVLREVALHGLLRDVSRGVPVVYADFLGFDEHAHRRGPDAETARCALASLDAIVAAVLAAVDAAPELGYDVFVLSDHGHVATRPFEALTGLALPDFVEAAERGEPLPRAAERARARRVLGTRARDGRRAGGIAIAEAGDLAHVYFLADGGPLPLDAVRARHWRVLAALSATRAVGLLAARGGRRGLAVLRGSVLDLADPSDVARLPHPDPDLLAAYLSDLVGLPDAGDLVVLGWRGPEREPVAYAWEFGSHGGVAPEELESFVVHPAGCGFRFDRVRRPAELHHFFERRYRAPVEAAASRAARAAGAAEDGGP
jgi:hypothetical protein